MKKALVLSGGGSKGAWSGGIIEYLIKEQNKDWDIVIGTSTGSLLAPLSSIKEIDRLKEAYTSVNNDSIFDIKPFKDNGKLRVFNAILRVIKGKSSLGSANNLKSKIRDVITQDDYNNIRHKGKDVLVTVSNMTKYKTEYKSIKTETYDDFCDWMLTSSSVPLLFEVVNKNGSQYLDGGVFESIPLQKSIDMGATEIDVIVLSSEVKKDLDKMNNMFDVVLRTIDLMNKEINKDDILLGQLHGEQSQVKINIYRVPFSLTNNALIFDKKQMTKWWQMGYDFAKNQSEVKKLLLKRTKTNKNYKIK